jgi:transposase
MSEQEIERVKVLQMVKEKRLTQKEGAERLAISERHLRRLLQKYQEKGAEGIISARRGRPSNNRMAPEKRAQIVALLQTTYQGFGPTLASEKLWERDGIKVSKETVRKILIEEGYHRPKVKKKERAFPSRPRRASFGELVQIDGSYHAWLEDRADPACLLLFVDDATSQVLAAKFVPRESYFAYADLCKDYFSQTGLPQAFYSDRFGVFRVNAKNVTGTEAITQFGRALETLGVELICANTPQAKGRVERANQTFQDRLIKEMRLEGISNYDQANLFLPSFLEIYNRKFGVQPRSPIDLHRSLPIDVNLDLIFTWRAERIISKNLQIQFEKTVYQIVTTRPAYTLKHRKVVVAKHADGTITVLLNNTPLTVQPFLQQPKQAEIVDSKQLHASNPKQPKPPAPDHPWRTYGKKLNGHSLAPPN